MRDSAMRMKFVTAVPPITKTTTTASTTNTISGAGGNTNGGIDTLGYRRLIAVFQAGAIAASGGCAFKLQESSDEGAVDTYADITGAAITSFADTDDNYCASIDLKLDGRERYIKAVATPTTTDSVALAVLFILCDPVSAPVTQVKTGVAVSS